LAVGRVRHLAGITTIAAEQRAITRDVEVDRPFVTLEVIPGSMFRVQVVTRQPKIFTARRLQVIPNRTAVGTPEFVTGDFHLHRALVDECIVAAIRMDCPDAVYFVPRALVTKHKQAGIGVRKEQMIDPIGAVKQRLHRAGAQVESE